MGVWALVMAWAPALEKIWALATAWAVEWALVMVTAWAAEWEEDMVMAWAVVDMAAWEWTWEAWIGQGGAEAAASTGRETPTTTECTALLDLSTASPCA